TIGDRTFRVEQILTNDTLSEEGQQMGHCVYTYAARIEAGVCAIWRLTVNGWPLVTIEVRSDKIVQARGRFNRMPTSEEGAVIAQVVHPLAGKDVEFQVKIVSVKPPIPTKPAPPISLEEIEPEPSSRDASK